MSGIDPGKHDRSVGRERGLRLRGTLVRVLLIASMLGAAARTNAVHAQSAGHAPVAPSLITQPDLAPGSTRIATRLQAGSKSHRLAGATIGFVIGAGATYLALNSGGSTSKCDRDANQDALSSGECLGLYALGGVAGAGLGAIIGGFIRTDRTDLRRIDGLGFGMTRDRAVVLSLRVNR